jgi:hypothetical protein
MVNNHTAISDITNDAKNIQNIHGNTLDIDEIFILLKAHNSWHREFQIIQKGTRRISEAEGDILIHIRFQSLVCTAAIRHPFN